MKKNSILKNLVALLMALAILTGVSCQQQDYDFTFAFLTDIHIRPERNATEGYKKAIQTVNEINPDFVITGGDLIDDALEANFERAEMLYDLYTQTNQEYEMPVYNTMGNHDVLGWFEESDVAPSHSEYGKNMFENRLGKRYESFDYKGWHFMLLDSISHDTIRKDYYGRIDADQMEWIKNDLKAVDKNTPIVLSTHIPFISVRRQIKYGSTSFNTRGIVIVNSKDVLDLFQGHNLKLVLQGHLHFLEEIKVEGTTFLTAGAVSADWWRGARDGLEEGFVVIKVRGNDFDWEYVDFGWEVVDIEN